MGTIGLSFLWLFAACAAYTDFRHRRVPNSLILGAAVAGLVINTCSGWTSLKAGLAGLALGLLLLLPAFTMRMVGGGDVKSLAVVGLFTGPHLLWISFLRGVLVGGAAALALLAAWRIRRLRDRPGRKQGINTGAAAWTLPYAGILVLCAAISAL